LKLLRGKELWSHLVVLEPVILFRLVGLDRVLSLWHKLSVMPLLLLLLLLLLWGRRRRGLMLLHDYCVCVPVLVVV
jgi:hypothetical protein